MAVIVFDKIDTRELPAARLLVAERKECAAEHAADELGLAVDQRVMTTEETGGLL